MSKSEYEEIFPACRAIAGPEVWDKIEMTADKEQGPEGIIESLKHGQAADGLPAYLADLARLEWTAFQAAGSDHALMIPDAERHLVNPSLELLELRWKNLAPLAEARGGSAQAAEPQPGLERILVFQGPKTGKVRIRLATDEDLLVLKMVVENIAPAEVATAGDLSLAAIEAAMELAVRRGILLAPPSAIRRDPALFARGESMELFQEAQVFTLQWHITQACDLHCKHCYDRSKRTALDLERGLAVLDDLRNFCQSRHVRGQVSFTGGNPFLYPHFNELYHGAADRGLAVAVLGNPAPRERIEELIAIRQPEFYQVSLEGLEPHNDMIRGAGHFRRVLEFLNVLRDLGVYSMVMLTLTRDNMNEVLPLGEKLRGRANSFTFNRLAMVGEGANLEPADSDAYAAFLEAYIKAAEHNPVMRLKDNLFNIIRLRRGREPFGGCAGFGCGAAFNFVAVLPDGEVHACRKFPSPIGNILKQPLAEIYDSEIARQYRAGSKACRTCSIRPVCGGCPAVVHGHGLDVFEARDPYCFLESDYH